jgi:hypothetical protein
MSALYSLHNQFLLLLAADGTQRTRWDERAWTPLDLLSVVKAFANSGLMTPEFTVAVFMRLDDFGYFKTAVLEAYPKSNPQALFHNYDDINSWFQGYRMNTSLVDLEMIFFVGGSGGQGRWFFEPDGEDKLRALGKWELTCIFAC